MDLQHALRTDRSEIPAPAGRRLVRVQRCGNRDLYRHGLCTDRCALRNSQRRLQSVDLGRQRERGGQYRDLGYGYAGSGHLQGLRRDFGFLRYRLRKRRQPLLGPSRPTLSTVLRGGGSPPPPRVFALDSSEGLVSECFLKNPKGNLFFLVLNWSITPLPSPPIPCSSLQPFRLPGQPENPPPRQIPKTSEKLHDALRLNPSSKSSEEKLRLSPFISPASCLVVPPSRKLRNTSQTSKAPDSIPSPDRC